MQRPQQSPEITPHTGKQFTTTTTKVEQCFHAKAASNKEESGVGGTLARFKCGKPCLWPRRRPAELLRTLFETIT